MSNDSANALNYLEPHKRLAQRIAIAQLLDEPIAQLGGKTTLTPSDEEDIKNFLICENILDCDEAEKFTFVANFQLNSSGRSTVIDLRNFTFNIFGASLKNPFDFESELIQFIESPSNQPPWSPKGTTTSSNTLVQGSTIFSKVHLTQEKLKEILEPLAISVKENGSKFRILQPCKKLSQLIAETWIDGRDPVAKAVFTLGNPILVNGFLLGRGLISSFDALHANNVVVDGSPIPSSTGSAYVGELIIEKNSLYKIIIPYPDEPIELVKNSKPLEKWVESEAGAPFTPVEFSRFIPLSC